mmetsp:Transcript_38927/g.105414  ORF Transcript_38927/g.105414 Transcript_38927/m.105414 type:complete len:211 (+) Transcript_38927:126-758(+)
MHWTMSSATTRLSWPLPPPSARTRKRWRCPSYPMTVPKQSPSSATRALTRSLAPSAASTPPSSAPLRPRPAPPLLLLLETLCLQMGQAGERCNHSSTHSRWKRWSQPSWRRHSPSANSVRQTMHCSCVSPIRSCDRHSTVRPAALISEAWRPCPRLRTSFTSISLPRTASSLAMVFRSNACRPRGSRRTSSRSSGGMKSQIVGVSASPSV